MTDIWRSPGGEIELRHGDYREVLSGVVADTVITDPPYGARIHDGNSDRLESMGRNPLGYMAWSSTDVAELVETLEVTGWFCAMTI